MTPYSSFAQFYDATMNDPAPKVERIHSLIQKYKPGAETLLELACGTGSVLKLLQSNYTVTGLDLSQEMLDIAKVKLPGVALHLGDMTNFGFDKKFDAILCIFDSINHLLQYSQWEQVFEKVAEHLNTSGIFIFDINTTGRLQFLADQGPGVKKFDDNTMTMEVKQSHNGIYDWDITVTEERNNSDPILHHDLIQEVSFPIAKIKESLSKDFVIKEILDNKGNPLDSDIDRAFFVCIKKSQ